MYDIHNKLLFTKISSKNKLFVYKRGFKGDINKFVILHFYIGISYSRINISPKNRDYISQP